MSRQAKVVILGCVAVIAFDIVASLSSRALNFPYASAGVGSYIIYFGVGFFAARAQAFNPVRQAVVAAAVTGFADASLGWAISWIIGPGKLPNTDLTPTRWAITALMVVTIAAVIGAVGGVAGRRKSRVGVNEA